MVRVCFAEDCSRPYHVFGCVFHAGKAVYCDDCQHERPWTFHTCTLRTVAPLIEDSTHGLCPECARVFIRNMRRNHRMNKISGQQVKVNRDP